jgi:hypothetical protein
VEKPAESVFRVFTETQFLSMSTECVQETLRLYNVVLTDCDVKAIGFDAKGLSTLKRTGAIVDLQGKNIFSSKHLTAEIQCNADQSIKASANLQSRVKKGTLNMMLQEANSANGRILNALDFPMPHTGVDWNSKYASDRVAWSSTEGCFLCQSNDPLPSSDLYWGTAATKGASHGLHLDCNGFGSTISPMCGAKVWFVARSSDDLQIPLADWDIYTKSIDVQRPGHLKGWMEVMYLTPGTRL